MPVHLQLGPRITMVFMVFAVLLLIVVGLSMYLIGRDTLQRAATAELLAAALEKEASISAWVDDNQSNLAVLAVSLQRRNTQANPDTATRAELLAELRYWIDAGSFPELLLLEPETGKVIVDTDLAEVGKLKESADFFIKGKAGPYVQAPFYSLNLQAPSMMVSQPLPSPAGPPWAVLAGRIDMLELGDIIDRRTGSHETDSTFLVNSSNLFVTQPRFISDPAVLQRGNFTPLVNRCLKGESGTASDLDYRGLPVLAVYRWLPARQLCLVVQIDQAEAYAPIEAFGITLLAISGIGLLAGSALAIGLARTITNPIRALQQGALRFGRGELDVRLPETATDELGALAHEFNTMASTLADKESHLRADATALEAANRRQVLEIGERKQAEVLLRESEQKLQALVDLLPVGVGALNAERKFVYSNQALESMLELTGSALSAVSVTQRGYLRQDGTPMPAGEFASARVGQEQRQIDNVVTGIIRADGTTMWTSVSAVLVNTSDWNVVTVTTDITERKRAEETLRESEERYRQLFEHIQESFIIQEVIVDNAGKPVDLRFLAVNRATESLLGKTRSEIVGRTRSQVSGQPDPEGVAMASRVASTGEPFHLIRQSAGFGDWFESFTYSLGSRVVATLALNITERKQAEQAALRRINELAGLNQMGQALSRLAEPAELLELIYSVIGQVLDTRNLYIALYDAASQWISFPIYAVDGQRVVEPARALANGLTECMIRTKKAVFLPRDMVNEARKLGVEPQGTPACCYLGVPMLVGDRVIGAIAVQDYAHEDVYDLGHLELLGTIAAQASIALENARLFSETRRRADQLQAINDVDQVISTVLDPETLATQLGQVLHTRLSLPHVGVGLIAGDELVFKVRRAPGELGLSDVELRIKVGTEGITGRVAHSGESILVPDVDLDLRFNRSEYWPHTRSELAVALKTQAGLIGVLNLESDQVDAFSPELVSLVETLASQIAKGIANARLFAETQQLARTDALTGIANRRQLFERGAREFSRARRFAHPLAALMVDIDHFKRVNDTHGHAAGDQILKIVARCFMTLVRDSDIVARYGGEEFVILLVETDLSGARVLAERLREQVAQIVSVTDEGPVTVTISLGVTAARDKGDDFASLLARADGALYAAKQAGRNRVEVG